ncbi:unnamed protein product [Ranitomeya imitator]|uniref:Uncharacterized protein n=1 Tax=Ranitomeya imitator TaxID=111125 RepID=A0ABN9L0G4_9NEOB|nr:unnamed protein product [Ranitomeya imitator]
MKRGEGYKLCKLSNIWSLTLICVLTAIPAGTYNIDEENPLVFKGPDGSLFGYSVIFHSYEDNKWIIVGAPKSNLTTRADIRNPGTIFKCKIGDNVKGICEIMDVAPAQAYFVCPVEGSVKYCNAQAPGKDRQSMPAPDPQQEEKKRTSSYEDRRRWTRTATPIGPGLQRERPWIYQFSEF